jgi:hydroxymethylpyrimidine/phosphomethylpyrimidine kinase
MRLFFCYFEDVCGFRGSFLKNPTAIPIRPILSIAGHDPSSGAGVTADLAVMAAHGYFGTSTITALTVQSTLGVEHTQPVDPVVLEQCLSFLVEDLLPAGVKIGMLATAANVRVVTEFVHKLLSAATKVVVVLDPVIRSSSGRELLDPAGLAALRDELLPLVDFATPNIEELGMLVGRKLIDEADVESAALQLASLGRGLNLIATGGDHSASDYLHLADGGTHWLRGEQVNTTSTHGTGCAFSSALLCRLCDGDEALFAAQRAKIYVTEAIRRAPHLGSGHGPLNLLWPFTRE